MTGAALHPVLQHHIVNSLGWTSLRPLQESAIAPVLDDLDVLLVAPTAGGKTEAAGFPLLSKMAQRNWPGLSVLYVCPLRALLNNLEPRLAAYAAWLGRRVGLWHGDTSSGARRRMLADPPDLLLTTPESLEAMLVSTRVDPHELFANVQAIVIDEVHAFAGDDRGWHLLAVLERLQRLAGRSIQRIGMSATVGNPSDLLHWLQGSAAGRPSTVVAPDPTKVSGSGAGAGQAAPAEEIRLDYVGSTANAATVIASLHQGEKRLAFCESRRQAEELAVALREAGTSTFVSHAALSIDERRRAERAFAEARDCVIVATSTLELGVDVGDLDRVIQVDAPRTVASFLQRLGRTGRRPGSVRNTLFLATRHDSLLHAAGLLRLWGDDWVEPITPPPYPRHLFAQQLLALCLQEHQVGQALWREWWNGLELVDDTAEEILEWLVSTGQLESDGGMLFIGPEAERRYGRRHFMELLSAFTADPAFVVIHGRAEVGTVDPAMLARKEDGNRLILLAGRRWIVTHVDWSRHRCYVEPGEGGSVARAHGQPGGVPLSYELCQSRRQVLLGKDPPIQLSRRAVDALAELREERSSEVAAHASAVCASREDTTWWTWAGSRANATIAATIAATIDSVVEDRTRFDNDAIRLRTELDSDELDAAIASATGIAPPSVSADAVRGLKFADSLPPHLAMQTLAARLADVAGAQRALRQPRQWVRA